MEYSELRKDLESQGIKLLAVSKTKPESAIMELYQKGQRDFGENRAQELSAKAEHLPADIKWHMIGHLQKNKVKYIAQYVHLIHSVDNLKLAQKIDKEAAKVDRTIDILIQIKIAKEESKYGYNWTDLIKDISPLKTLQHIRICGVMGMGTLTDNPEVTHAEFAKLRQYFETLKASHFNNDDHFCEVSMGMSGDYRIAMAYGTTMVRIGSLLFGPRT